MKYILAHDLGTSGNKATLFDSEGRMIESCTEVYSTHYFNGNWAEQNPEDWWNAVCVSSSKVLKSVNKKDLAAVSFSGQMMACLCVDKSGVPLKNALIYCDQRAETQAQQLIDNLGFNSIYRITGHRPSSSYSLAKLMWIRDNEPDIYRDTYRILQAKDYMNFRLTGSYYTDYNDASGTNAFDLRKFGWSEPMIKASGVSDTLFPPAVPSVTIIGEVTREASEATGIPAGTPVAAGSGDGGCATLGAGSYESGQAYCYMGSSSWVSVTSDRPIEDREMKTFTWAHPIAGLYHPCGTMQTAGSSINWFSSIMLENSGSFELEEMNRLAAECPPGSGGVFFLPYLLGERSPWWNPDAKGCFIGLNLNTERKNLYRSVFEGIAMNLGISLDIMREYLPVNSVNFIGGGANGKTLRKIFADVFGIDIEIPNLLSEATSMGAALIGGVASGAYSDFSMVENMNPIVESINPDKANHAFYRDHGKIFVELYTDLKDSFGKIRE